MDRLFRVCRRVLTTTGTMVFIDDNNLIHKSGTKTMFSNNGTKVCQQKCVIAHQITYKYKVIYITNCKSQWQLQKEVKHTEQVTTTIKWKAPPWTHEIHPRLGTTVKEDLLQNASLSRNEEYIRLTLVLYCTWESEEAELYRRSVYNRSDEHEAREAFRRDQQLLLSLVVCWWIIFFVFNRFHSMTKKLCDQLTQR